MDILEDNKSSQFEDKVKEWTWDIQGIPHFITTMYRKGYALCNEYNAHTLKAAKTYTVKVLYHQIELAFWRAWSHVVNPMIDKACTEVKNSANY